jgi:hypothetical protein
MATATAYANGILFNALVRALLNTDKLTIDDARTMFLGAASVVDSKSASDEVQAAVHKQMRSRIEESAKGFGIQIPPRGQTGIERAQ